VGFESTITEQDMDANARQLVQKFKHNGLDSEPDLDVDGLSDSIAARLKRFLAFGRE